MQKIITVFQRNYETDRLVRDEVVPGAEWVLAGEGVATRKWDGACCMVRDGQLFKRLELKAGKTAPSAFEPMQPPDEVTGAIPGWVPVGDGPEDKWFRVALGSGPHSNGTYEAIGPHFGGGHHEKNPEHCAFDVLIPHGLQRVLNFPRDFDGMGRYFSHMTENWDSVMPIEGVVFHHPDGRMAKIKARDYGIKRPTSAGD